jgi:four helix bundle protein
MASKLINHHWELDVYKLSVETSMELFRTSKLWPKEEQYSLTDQIRRSSRSVSAAIAEAWRRRKYEAVFVNKLNEAEGEAAETQTWIEYAVKCEYLTRKEGARLFQAADRVIGKLVKMGNEPDKWTLAKSRPSR